MTGRPSYREGAGFGVLSFASVGVVSLISAFAVARLYGVEEVGRWALAMAPAMAAAILSSIRGRPAVVRELATLPPRAPRVTALFAAVLSLSTVVSVVVGALVLAAATALYRGPLDHPDVVGPTTVAMMGWVVLANPAFNVDTVLAAFRAGRPLFWIRLDQAVGFVAFAALLAAFEPTAMSLVLAGVISSAIALLHRVVAARAFMPLRVSAAELRDGFRVVPDVVRFSLKIVPGGLCDGIANETPVWVLATLGGVPQVGAYNRAAQLQKRFTEVSYRLNEMLFPTLVERRAAGDGVGFDRALLDSLRYAAAAMLLPAAAVGGAAEGVMRLFGSGFEQAAGALAVLCVIPAAATLSNMQRHALYAVDRPWQGSLASALRLAATLVGCVALTNAFGLTGAALGLAAGYAVDLTFSWALTQRSLWRPAHELVPWSLRVAVPLAYGAGFAAARGAWTALPALAALPLALAAGAAAYAAVFWLAGGVADRDRRRAGEIAGALRRRFATQVRPVPERSPLRDA